MDSTLLAALLGAAVASIGVTLAKDTKVSEFRQAWIDKLREDVAEFISLVSRAFDESHNPYVHALGPVKKEQGHRRPHHNQRPSEYSYVSDCSASRFEG